MEPIGYQVVVDCHDAHVEARFWAAALGFAIESNDELIRGLLDAGVATDDDVITVDEQLFWRTAMAIRHPDDVGLSGLAGADRRVLFMAIDDPTPGKNRWHLDLNVGRDRIDAEVERLRALGATEIARIDEPGSFHAVLGDPEGNQFCVH